MSKPGDLAVLIEMASLAGKTKHARYNYLFVALGSEKARQKFSGEDIGFNNKIRQIVNVDALVPSPSMNGDGKALLNTVKTGVRLMNGELPVESDKSVN
jgi:hypothetical protein